MTNINQLVLESQKLNTPIPDEYIKYISNNKLRPTKCMFNDDVMVNNFFSRSGINSNLELVKDHIPAGTIPIADDPAGNLILLGVSKSNSGKVYFWDHEIESGNVKLIAKSFNEFVKKLH